MAFRFIHTADLHLDSPLRSLSLRDPDLAGLVGDATRSALTAIVDLCLAERVDALLIAGDLYDGDQTSMKTARFLADEMGRLDAAGIRVFKVRGNHDAMSRITKQLALPPGVTVFGDRPEAVRLERPGMDLAIHGLSFRDSHAPDSLLPRFAPPVEGAVNIGLLHTSLGGAAGHDVYAPCSLADLSATGFRYWALGHVHRRAEHRGAVTVVMPGMPQGRDINEAGAKTVTLVTVSDDGSLAVEERATSIAEFARVAVDLSGAADWSEALEAVGAALETARAAAASPHLVARLSLAGRTPAAFRLRRDRDLLREEIERRAARLGHVWIEAMDLRLEEGAARAAGAGEGADPLVELGALIRGEIVARRDVRDALAAMVREVVDELPPEVRGLGGDDEAGFERFLDELIAEGSEDILARLGQRPHGGAA